MGEGVDRSGDNCKELPKPEPLSKAEPLSKTEALFTDNDSAIGETFDWDTEWLLDLA